MIVNTSSIRLKLKDRNVLWAKRGMEIDTSKIDENLLKRLVFRNQLVESGDESQKTKDVIKVYGKKMPSSQNKMLGAISDKVLKPALNKKAKPKTIKKGKK